MGASRQPSANSNVTSALDELLVIITGSAEKEEHMLKQISSKLNKSTLGKIVSEAAAPQIEFLSAAANMLTAIASYLFGDKGVNLKTPASQLLGKIKNNAPILGEKSFEQVIVDDNNKKRGGNTNAQLDFIITLEGIAGNDLYALCDAITLLKESAGVDDIVELDTMPAKDIELVERNFINTNTIFEFSISILFISFHIYPLFKIKYSRYM